MPKCELTIELDDANRQFNPGDKIRGRVRVRVSQDVTCNALQVGLRWSTHGSGNEDSETGVAETLFEGEWHEGEDREYPFELTAPAGPASYNGHHVSIAHRVYATADIPWAFDPKAQVDFHLSGAAVSWTKYLPEPADEVVGRHTSGPASLIWTALFVTAALIAWWLHAPVIAVIIGVIALALAVGTVAEKIRDVKIGPIECQLSPLVVCPGEQIHFAMSFRPRSDVNVHTLNLVLTGEESAESGSGTNRTTHTHELGEVKHVISGPRTCFAGDKHEFSDVITLKDTDAYSFKSSNNQVIWKLEVKLELERLLDWSETRELLVRPRG